jgi:hypothetical protein
MLPLPTLPRHLRPPRELLRARRSPGHHVGLDITGWHVVPVSDNSSLIFTYPVATISGPVPGFKAAWAR